MSESGPIPNPDDCLDFDAPWSYFMSWSDLVVQQNTNEHIQDVFSNERVLKFEIPVIPTAVDPVEQTGELKIWPNPVVDQLTISFPASQYEVSILITDLGGRELYNRKLKNNSLTLDVKNYLPAMYIIHVVAGNKTETGYFIKQ
jgi:hypothetical protein